MRIFVRVLRRLRLLMALCKNKNSFLKTQSRQIIFKSTSPTKCQILTFKQLYFNVEIAIVRCGRQTHKRLLSYILSVKKIFDKPFRSCSMFR